MAIKLALAHVVDSRTDFYEKRRPLAEEELSAVDWLREEYQPLDSGLLCSNKAVAGFAEQAARWGAQALVIHLPIWADPIFTVKLSNYLSVPILLLGNSRPETSSLVGLLGAGGALDQIGRPHFRVFEHQSGEARNQVRAFINASAVIHTLRGQTLVLFGGRSLGIFTAVADPAQWQRLFGVDIEYADQQEISSRAEGLPADDVSRAVQWLAGSLGSIRYDGAFTSRAFERQVRSYLSTKQLAEQRGADFIGVKCQPELSDGYVTQCVSHMLMNGKIDADGGKDITVHACESDADGALTMQILHLISGGKPAGLLDVRWYDPEEKLWTLANCGALPAEFFHTGADPSGLSAIHMEPHIFGRGGGGALPAVVAPQQVTLARLCRKNGHYWMAIVSGNTIHSNGAHNQMTTPAFPKAFVRSSAGTDFLNDFGSNHIHLVSGDYTQDLVAFCTLTGIDYKLWK